MSRAGSGPERGIRATMPSDLQVPADEKLHARSPSHEFAAFYGCIST